METRVSICCSVLNQAEWLREMIASVVAQTYTGWELIVVDDGSMWGASTDLISVYGAVPVAQSSLPTVGAASTYATYNQSTAEASTWGFASALQMTSFVRQVSTITVALRTFGLIA